MWMALVCSGRWGPFFKSDVCVCGRYGSHVVIEAYDGVVTLIVLAGFVVADSAVTGTCFRFFFVDWQLSIVLVFSRSRH